VPRELSILSGTATPGALGVENLRLGSAGIEKRSWPGRLRVPAKSARIAALVMVCRLMEWSG
jgi:hypothetical protein